MNEEITGVKPPMGFPHIKNLTGSEATILQVANSQGDILGYATLDDIDAYIEQKVSETVHSFSQKQIFQDVTINGTFDGNNVVNQSKLNGALANYFPISNLGGINIVAEFNGPDAPQGQENGNHFLFKVYTPYGFEYLNLFIGPFSNDYSEWIPPCTIYARIRNPVNNQWGNWSLLNTFSF